MPKFHLGKNLLDRRKSVERDLINAESALGRTLFGAVPAGRIREFFCLKENVWLWYENGQTIRYEVRKNGVFKRIDTGPYTKVTGEELKNFATATKSYLRLVKRNIYHEK